MEKMLFQLTPEIIDMIIFGMENQSDEYYIDIKTGDVLSESQAEEEYDDEYIDSFTVPVPEWLPSDGFQLMESFVADLHNPVYKEALRKILSAGKGAFRNFKDTVKEHESLTQQWYQHKDNIMRSRVIEWYNLNSEILKYQDINENTDETENLVLSDFVFSINNPKWKNIIREKSTKSIKESFEDKKDLLGDYLIDRMEMFSDIPGNIPVFACAESLDGELIGVIGGIFVRTGTSRRMVAVVNTIWIEKKFRGLGIARHLIDLFSKKALENKAEKLIFELFGKGSVLVSTLESRGGDVFITTMAVNIKNL
ncbi:MAG: GNAT family N-acetyltransferase [Spirochaetaceae bacterium]|nr:GNAT family N-acetyltransferase [Spirochaetaceae bacterium]